MGAKKVLMILGVVVALLLVGSGIAVYALSRTPALVPYDNGVDPAARALQTQIAVALVAIGVESPLVVLYNDTALAMYELPEGDARTPEEWQRIVLGALAPFAPRHVSNLVAMQFVDGNVTQEWSVPTAQVLAYEAGTITTDELEAAVTRTTF